MQQTRAVSRGVRVGLRSSPHALMLHPYGRIATRQGPDPLLRRAGAAGTTEPTRYGEARWLPKDGGTRCAATCRAHATPRIYPTTRQSSPLGRCADAPALARPP
eukprot:139830-Chlamydomonas_euryale.AAC.3